MEDGYTEADLRAHFLGQLEHKPVAKKRSRTNTRPFNLVIDIQSKLQSKGVRTVVIGYDGDAVESVKRTAERLKPYFEVFIADIADAAKDWDELTEAEIYGIFACRLLSVLEYKLKKVQER